MYSIDKDSKGNCLISLRYFHALVNVESITGEICSVTYGTALVFGTTGTFIGKVNASSNDMIGECRAAWHVETGLDGVAGVNPSCDTTCCCRKGRWEIG
jgi:hypothetical protein